MTCKLMSGNAVLYELEYYSVGGGFIEWKGYQPPKKGHPKYAYSTMKELLAHAADAKCSIAQIVMANEVAVSGNGEAGICAFVDKINDVMVGIVKSGLSMPPPTLPGPIKLKTKAGEVYKRAMEDRYEKERGVGVISAYALAGSEENGRGHLVVTAPTGGSAGVLPALSTRWVRAAEVSRKRRSGTDFWQARQSAISVNTTPPSSERRAAVRRRSASRLPWAPPSWPRPTTCPTWWWRTPPNPRCNIIWA
jgi:hypothetical protein